jgi:hypothetical protein
MKTKSDSERSLNMKTNRIRILVVASLAFLAASACVNPAAAQISAACKGNFTLPQEVRWQGKVLPAGDYSFVLKSASMPALIELRGPSGVDVLMTAGLSIDNKIAQSYLTIEQRGDSGYVRELYLAPLGVHFSYNVPKVPKEELLAKGPVSTERVLVSTVGN